MKTAKKISIIAAVLLMAGGLALSLTAFAMIGGDIVKLNTMTFTETTYTTEDRFDSIYIEGAECDVRFAASEDGLCRVDCVESEKIYHTVAVEDDTLTIKRVDARKWYERIGIYWGSMKITVYLPETEYDRLYVRTLSGDIEITAPYRFNTAEVYGTSGDVRFSAAVNHELNVKTVSGDLTVRGVKASRLSARSTSGDVSLSSVEAAIALQMKATSGNLTLTDAACGALTTDCTSGDTALTDVDAYSIESNSVSGDIKLLRCDASTLSLKATSGDVYGSLLSDKIFSTETTSGNVQLPPSTTGGVCKIKTVSGDIRITIE